MRKGLLLPALSIVGLIAVPGMALAQGAPTWGATAPCDPSGPRGAFVDGIPAADNPAWCDMARPGFGMATETEPAPDRPRHGRRLRHRN